MKHTILVTSGDPAGIGPDICIQLAASGLYSSLFKHGTKVAVLGDADLFRVRARQLNLTIECVAIDSLNNFPKEVGDICMPVINIKNNVAVIAREADKNHATHVIQQLELAVALCLKKKADAMVTGPVSKHLLQMADYDFIGHTEWLADLCDVKRTVMSFIGPNMKVALCTTHVPLAEVSTAITKELIIDTCLIVRDAMQLFWPQNSVRLFLLGLNPHAGEQGTLGLEEKNIIEPATEYLRASGLDIVGPVAADSFFLHPKFSRDVCVVALYHDQVLPLIKYAHFSDTVNLTMGLPIVRTSVDHGTAFDIAASGKSDCSSLQAAILLADNLTAKRGI